MLSNKIINYIIPDRKTSKKESIKYETLNDKI